jgi:cytosine/adenosine deaminase-related metal-dependent hydrolase
MSADFVAFDMSGVGHAGAGHDPVAALVFCTPTDVSTSVINGRVVVRDGHLLTADLPRVLTRHRELARTLFERAAGQ